MSRLGIAWAMIFIVCMSLNAQTSFWPRPALPDRSQTSDRAAVILGLKFHSDVAGYVRGVSYYKGADNTGSHVGILWTAKGEQLASVTFSDETAVGWQQALFDAPVAIEPNITYVISYTAPNGGYAQDQYYDWSTLRSGSLHVSNSSPGVFAYGSGILFPADTWRSSNYWVDVLFTPASSISAMPDLQPPSPSPNFYSISGNVNGSSATLTLSGTMSGFTDTDDIGNYSFTNLPNGIYIIGASQWGYAFSPATSTVMVNDASVTDVNFVSTAVLRPIQHTVILTWEASTTPNLKGYAIYRTETAGGAFAKLALCPISETTYTDSTVASGRTYYYVATAVNQDNAESVYSNEAMAVVPSP